MSKMLESLGELSNIQPISLFATAEVTVTHGYFVKFQEKLFPYTK